jgi:carboxyl-terminal processing protease
LTTARYYTPSGRSIQAVGIEPDIKVAMAKIETMAQAGDHTRSEAQLRGALRNDTLTQTSKPPEGKVVPLNAGTPAPDSNAPPASQGAPAGANGQGSPPAETFKMGDPASDYQLARAIDLLHGLSLYKGTAAKAN